MYNNRDNLVVGNDYYDLATGKYVFTMIYHDREDERIVVDGVPSEVKSSYGDYMNDIYAYNKETLELFDEGALCDVAYESILVSKERWETIEAAKQTLLKLVEDAGIKEPFVYENGEISVGKEQVLSAHINAGQEHGWIQSSICW